jgi:hypothetical protein
MSTETRQSAREHDESDAARAWPGSRSQGLKYGERRSMGRRLFRAVFRFIVAVLSKRRWRTAYEGPADAVQR